MSTYVCILSTYEGFLYLFHNDLDGIMVRKNECNGVSQFYHQEVLITNSCLHHRRQFSFVELVAWLRNIRWDSSKATDWQKFFEESKKSAVYGTSTNANFTVSQKDPVYEDLRAKPCSKNKGDRLQSPIFFLSFSMALLTYGFQ